MKTIQGCEAEGYAANLNGVKITDCPYSLKSLRTRDLRAGWHKGYQQALKPIPKEWKKREKAVSLPWSILK
jgi:ribosome modulation factor